MESLDLRTALLASLERDRDGNIIALKSLGGRSVLEWQVALTREMGCRRIFCLSEESRDAHFRIQTELERAEIEFHIVPNHLAIVGGLTADEDLLVIADGLVIDRAIAVEGLVSKRGILALPEQIGVSAGLERIDSRHAWGGIALLPGYLAERLADLPADGNPQSFLLRLGLQARIALIDVDPDAVADRQLLLARDHDALKEREQSLLHCEMGSTPIVSPGLSLALIVARSMAPEGLRRGPASGYLIGAAFTAIGFALTSIAEAYWLFLALALARFAFDVARGLRDLGYRVNGVQEARKIPLSINLIFDIIVIISLSIGGPVSQFADRLVRSAVMIGTLRLAQNLAEPRLSRFLSDRLVLVLTLALASALGMVDRAVGLWSLVAVLGALAQLYRRKITRV